MAKKQKQKKTKEEKIVENYFPVEEDNLKLAVEKQIQKQQPAETIIKGAIEKSYSKLDKNDVERVTKIKKPKRKYVRKKTTKTSSTKTRSRVGRKKGGTLTKSNQKFIPPKISLKKGGYELVITEKPQAALKIASALGSSTKRDSNKIPYYEVDRDGKKIIVGCAVGHLFTLKQNSTGAKVPTFDVSWVPNFLVRKKDFTKKYYDNLLKLAKGAGSLTIATDYDIEGEVIGMNVMRFIGGQEDANRMKFSTLTEKELNKAYESKSSSINWGQAIAGETRHYLDWFYGINLSRALMNAIKTTGRFKIMSIGRVQGPALNLIVQKEREIQAFKPKTFWQIFINVKQGDIELELKHNKDIFDKKELKKFENLKGRKAQAQTKKTEQIISPNPPFNLTSLQTESYKFHGITPSKTLQSAQSLYLAGLISYPRTSSQKLPESVGYKEILKKVSKQFKVEKLITKSKPIEGAKSDPAHPSIYPTGNMQILSGDEEKIYNLIARRFLALFCDDAIIENKTIRATVSSSDLDLQQLKGQGVGQKNSNKKVGGIIANQQNLIFSAKGSQIRKKAWMEIYPVKLKENEIPDLNGEVEIINSRTEEKQTQPPKRYSPASIISELEKRNLGTKATRASILETLYDRGYIKEKSIEATSLGMSLISTLEKYSPVIIDEKLTKNFQDEMDLIVESKKDFKKKEDKVVGKAKTSITKIAGQFEEHENKIGKELVKATDKIIEQERIANTLTECPTCKKGNLRILYGKQFRRYFVGCSNYPECKKTYTLPPNGAIKRTDKQCEECSFPKLIRLSKGKRPWEFCFNPECKTNKERVEEYKNRKEEK